MRTLKRIFVLLAMVSVASFTTAAVAQTVSGDVKLRNGVIMAIIGIALLGWMVVSLSRHRISFTRTYLVLLFSSLFVLVSSAYLDINSPADIKTSVTRSFATEKGAFRARIDLVVQRAELKFVDVVGAVQDNPKENAKEPTQNSKADASTSKKPPEISVTNRNVRVGGGILIGADGHRINLYDNTNAVNPAWEQLKGFLLKDNTDTLRYDLSTFVCADFAERLHNSAETAGLRAAYVTIKLGPCSYYPKGGGHALNAFDTTDRGLVFIDCTSSNQGTNADKIVAVELGKDYIPRSIFPTPGWNEIWGNMGKVLEIETIQW